MLTKRIIACLDVDDGRVVKGVRFVNLRDAGDPAELAKRHSDSGADEIVLLDISAAHQRRATLQCRGAAGPPLVGVGRGQNLLNCPMISRRVWKKAGNTP